MSSGSTPMRCFAASGSSSMSSPRMRIAPAVGRTRPVSILSVVDLPAPLRPRSPTKAPRGSARLRSSTATLSPKRFVTRRARGPRRWRALPSRRPPPSYARGASASRLPRRSRWTARRRAGMMPLAGGSHESQVAARRPSRVGVVLRGRGGGDPDAQAVARRASTGRGSSACGPAARSCSRFPPPASGRWSSPPRACPRA